MKTNEAPEKIYINSNLENRTWLIGKGDISFIEYVRKDAFIEMAVEYIANNMGCDGYTLQTKAKFIKDFRNLMNGKNE